MGPHGPPWAPYGAELPPQGTTWAPGAPMGRNCPQKAPHGPPWAPYGAELPPEGVTWAPLGPLWAGIPPKSLHMGLELPKLHFPDQVRPGGLERLKVRASPSPRAQGPAISGPNPGRKVQFWQFQAPLGPLWGGFASKPPRATAAFLAGACFFPQKTTFVHFWSKNAPKTN